MISSFPFLRIPSELNNHKQKKKKQKIDKRKFFETANQQQGKRHCQHAKFKNIHTPIFTHVWLKLIDKDDHEDVGVLYSFEHTIRGQ